MNNTQQRIIELTNQNTIALLREERDTLRQAVRNLSEAMTQREETVCSLMEMIERSGVELLPVTGTELMALKEAKALLEEERNKIVERVETALKGSEENISKGPYPRVEQY